MLSALKGVSFARSLGHYQFRVQWPPKLVLAIRNRAEEQVRMAPIWEQQRIENLRRQIEEHNASLQDYEIARQNHACLEQEVKKK